MSFLDKYKEKPERLFNTLFWNFMFGYIPFSILAAILTIFGVVPVYFNDEPRYGIGAALIILLMSPLLVLGTVVITWFYYSLGNYFLRQFLKLRK